jgi:predicted O-methyltransferase YrrM
MMSLLRRLHNSLTSVAHTATRQDATRIYIDEYPSFGDFDRAALRELIRAAIRPGCRMLELGSWLGTGSTQVFIEELRPVDGVLYCVDTWRGSPNVVQHQSLASTYDVIATFRHNMRKAGGDDIVRMLAMNSEEAAAIMADSQFDLIFIDADHSYRSTKADIAAWQSKLRPGGILCGHDCETRVTADNFERLTSVRDLDHIDGGGTPFLVNHPGVILAVHEAFGSQAELYADRIMTLEDGASGRATLWFLPPHGMSVTSPMSN